MIPTTDQLKFAVKTLRNHPEKEDAQILELLAEEGHFPPQLACRVVEFIPLVYCRVLLDGSGVSFPDTYDRRLSYGSTAKGRLLSKHPVWVAALEHARSEVENGVAGDDIINLASRSAEFQVASRLLNQRSTLEDLVFIPMLLMWPGDDLAEEPAKPRRWWQRSP